MLFEEFEALTRGLATYQQYEAINAIYMTSSINKKDAATLWYLSYGKDTQPPPRTLEQKMNFVRKLPKEEQNRLFWAVYDYEKPLIFDRETGVNFTLLVGNRTKTNPYYYLHLALYHKVEVETGKIWVIPTGWRNYGHVQPCWRSLRDPVLVKNRV